MTQKHQKHDILFNNRRYLQIETQPNIQTKIKKKGVTI